MTLIRYVKKQYDRWCETMDQEPAVFHMTELDYRYMGMDVEMAGGTESMRNGQAAVDLCSRTLAQLRDADLGLIEAYPRSATAVAMEDGVKLREIGEKEFSAYFSEQPERVLLIMRQLSARLRDRTADYQKALDTLNEMKGTKGTPDKRSKSLRDRIKEFFNLYAEAMAMNTLDRCDGLNPNDPFFFID